jgi:WD40 repeat protein
MRVVKLISLFLVLSFSSFVFAGGHEWKITQEINNTISTHSASFSPDINSPHLLTLAWNNSARLIDAKSGEIIYKFKHSGPSEDTMVYSTVFSPDGSQILTGSRDERALIWDAKTGKQVMSFKNTHFVNNVSFSPKADKIVTALWDNTAIVWDVKTGEKIITLKYNTGADDEDEDESDSKHMNTAQFSPDGEQVLTASNDGLALLWDINSGKIIKSFYHPYGGVSSAMFSPDGTKIVTASSDKTAVLWDIKTAKNLMTFKHEATVQSAVFHPNGKQILTASYDKTAVIWDLETGAKLASLEHKGPFCSDFSALFNYDGSKIITTARFENILIWEVL